MATSASRLTPNPRLPADHGLPALGMICHASLNVATIALTLLLLLQIATFRSADHRFLAVGILVLGFLRANFHRQAAECMIDRSPRVFGAVKRYALVALITTLLMALAAQLVYRSLPLSFFFAFATLSLYWPTTLLLLVFRRELVKTFDAAESFHLDLVPRDRSLEGLGLLMVAFASISLGILLVGLAAFADTIAMNATTLVLLTTVALLAARGVYQIVHGLRLLQSPDLPRFDRFVDRYLLLAIATIVMVAVSLLLLADGELSIPLLGTLLLSGYLLLFWPLALRRFHRRLLPDPDTDIGATSTALPEPGPSPDRGLTALGYLLCTIGVTALIASLVPYIGTVGFTPLGPLPSRTFGLADLIGVLHALGALWAGLELIRMSPRHKNATLVYVAFAMAAIVADFALGNVRLDTSDPTAVTAAEIVVVAVHLVPPVLAVALLRRRPPHQNEVTPPRGTPARLD